MNWSGTSTKSTKRILFVGSQNHPPSILWYHSIYEILYWRTGRQKQFQYLVKQSKVAFGNKTLSCSDCCSQKFCYWYFRNLDMLLVSKPRSIARNVCQIGTFQYGFVFFSLRDVSQLVAIYRGFETRSMSQFLQYQ